VNVRIDYGRRRDEAVTRDRPRVRPDRQVHAVGDIRIAGASDPDDATVLDPQVGLHDPQQGIDDDDAADHGVQLALGRRGILLGHPRAPVLRVAPECLIGGLGQVLLDPDPQVGVG
jgi:hypothetical protein